jgi:hypothetical protein
MFVGWSLLMSTLLMPAPRLPRRRSRPILGSRWLLPFPFPFPFPSRRRVICRAIRILPSKPLAICVRGRRRSPSSPWLRRSRSRGSTGPAHPVSVVAGQRTARIASSAAGEATALGSAVYGAESIGAGVLVVGGDAPTAYGGDGREAAVVGSVALAAAASASASGTVSVVALLSAIRTIALISARRPLGIHPQMNKQMQKKKGPREKSRKNLFNLQIFG